MFLQVGGTTSQKVWVFTLEEEDPGSQGIVTDLLVKMTRPRLIIVLQCMTKGSPCSHLQIAGQGR